MRERESSMPSDEMNQPESPADQRGFASPPVYPSADYYRELAERGTVTPSPPLPTSIYHDALPQQHVATPMRSHNVFTRWAVRYGGVNRILLSIGSALLSLLIYYFVFKQSFAPDDWQGPFFLSLGIVGLFTVHEFGHVFALRLKKLPATFPIFIPLIGAFVTLPNQPISTRDDAEISIAGPFLGGVGALICLVIAIVGYDSLASVSPEPLEIWLQLAYFGFLLNLFNLFPIMPLDGGHIAKAISPLLTIVGFVGLVLLYIYTRNSFLLLIGIFGFQEVLRIFNGPRYAPNIRAQDRVRVIIMYVALAAVLAIGYWLTSTYEGHVAIFQLSRLFN